ncbi:hypothetical protein P618_200317 [Holospora obtusa F1]|uniref:Uncharacterized protein n=1 Tax=Holospora obtusa F1 TaxID=1399147 RepID=W6TEW7_HOLOB|nr:hypothetical protein [Holospora obtusa]ETZ07476.1 hypothetical protein P618_200317 [Holospora obtusa F1]
MLNAHNEVGLVYSSIGIIDERGEKKSFMLLFRVISFFEMLWGLIFDTNALQLKVWVFMMIPCFCVKIMNIG